MALPAALFFSFAASVLMWFVLFPKSFGRHLGKVIYEVLKVLP
jgi:hypothetical protein